MNAAEHSYVIVGGAPRSGTTSMYRYLASHPDACASAIKETRYFLDPDYPLPSGPRFDGHNLAEYERYFAHCNESRRLVRVEASPDYLYSRNALRIAEVLPKSVVVFILRDPVTRMVSWYNYARQRGLVSETTSFREYVLMQAGRPVEPDTPTFLRALDQCRYQQYLEGFRQAFGARCHVFALEDLQSNPLAVMKHIASAGGLDPDFYSNYEFRVENASLAVRSPRLSGAYLSLRRLVAQELYGIPLVKRLLRWPSLAVGKLLAVHRPRVPHIEVPQDLRDLIARESIAKGSSPR